MTRVTYVEQDGSKTTLEGADGQSVMQIAVAQDVEGIVAECGGNLMCATCHVYVDHEFDDVFPPVGEVENEMLDMAASERTSNSRLSCQLVAVTPDAEVTVTLPETQL